MKLFSAGLTELAAKRPGGGGGIPYHGLYGGALPKRGTFFRLQVFERVGVLLVEVYEREGKSVIWICERVGAKRGGGGRNQRAEQINFMALYSRENILFL